MKRNVIRWTVAIASPLLFSACSKTQDAPAPAVAERPATAAPAPETPPAAEAKAPVENTAAEAVKAPDTAPAPPVPEPVQPAAASPAQALLEKIRGLIAEKKYPEALAALSEVSNVSLSDEQQQVVERLKAQAQGALTKQSADQGLKAAGNLLNRNK